MISHVIQERIDHHVDPPAQEGTTSLAMALLTLSLAVSFIAVATVSIVPILEHFWDMRTSHFVSHFFWLI